MTTSLMSPSLRPSPRLLSIHQHCSHDSEPDFSVSCASNSCRRHSRRPGGSERGVPLGDSGERVGGDTATAAMGESA